MRFPNIQLIKNLGDEFDPFDHEPKMKMCKVF